MVSLNNSSASVEIVYQLPINLIHSILSVRQELSNPCAALAPMRGSSSSARIHIIHYISYRIVYLKSNELDLKNLLLCINMAIRACIDRMDEDLRGYVRSR